MAVHDAAPHVPYPRDDPDDPDDPPDGLRERVARLEERSEHQGARIASFEQKLEAFQRDFEDRSAQLERWLRTTTITVSIAAITMVVTIVVALWGH